jgi:hypothetical protein
MELKLPTIDVYICLLHKNDSPKRYLPDVFFTKGEANLFAKEYLSLRQKKKLSIKVERLSNEDFVTKQ